jgi:hypothetical protein
MAIEMFSMLGTTDASLRLGLVQKAAVLVRLVADLLLHGHPLPAHGFNLGLQLPNARVILRPQSLHAHIVAQAIAHRFELRLELAQAALGLRGRTSATADVDAHKREAENNRGLRSLFTFFLPKTVPIYC